MSSRELKFTENTAKTASLFKMAAKLAMKENLQCTSKYGHLRISQNICHVGWQILRASLPYMGIVTICWIIISEISTANNHWKSTWRFRNDEGCNGGRLDQGKPFRDRKIRPLHPESERKTFRKDKKRKAPARKSKSDKKQRDSLGQRRKWKFC